MFGGPLKTLLIAFLTLFSYCKDRELRGYTEPSEDGQTYLVVLDDNGGGCGSIFLNGKVWPHPIGGKGLITPGSQELDCRDPSSFIEDQGIGFVVEKGTVFYFDYWGP